MHGPPVIDGRERTELLAAAALMARPIIFPIVSASRARPLHG